MSFPIRAFTPHDYEAVAKLHNKIHSEYPLSADQLRFEDDKRDPKCLFRRYLVEANGHCVAMGDYNQRIWSYHPQIFDLDIAVLPDHRRQGIGSALYDHLCTEIAHHNPIKLNALYREDFVGSTEFLEQRGFHEEMRAWESRLNLTQFDFELYKSVIESVEESGIKLAPLSQFPQSEARDRSLHHLEQVLGEDVPSTDPFTPVSYEFFVERTLKNPNLYPEAYYLALDGENYIGMSALWKSQGNRDLYTGLTGVLRDYRRRGIALALKVKTFMAARDAGYSLIKTWNASTNQPMLAINVQLGFVRQPAWISVTKEL